MIKFSDWIVARESSSFTRLRDAAAKGLMPPIPDASINSRSTATPAQQKALLGKGNKKKKKKSRKKKVVAKHNEIDAFVRQVEELEKEIESLRKAERLKRPEKKD